MTCQLIHGDARHVSDVLEPASVDLIVTSPPTIDGQLGLFEGSG